MIDAGGVFDKFPGLQIVLGHCGEVVLFFMERLNVLARVTKLDRPVAEYFKQNLYVTSSGMWSEDYLQRTLKIEHRRDVGEDTNDGAKFASKLDGFERLLRDQAV